MTTATKRYLFFLILHVCALLSAPIALSILDLHHPARRVLLFYAGVLLIVFALSQVALFVRETRWLKAATTAAYVVVSVLLLTLASIHADNTINYGALVADSAGAIFQTDTYEAIHYILTYVAPMTFVLATLWILATAVPAAGTLISTNPQLGVVMMASFCLLVGGATLTSLQSQDALLIFHEAAAYRTTLEKYHASRRDIQSDPAVSQPKSDFEGHIIVILGESLSRHHMSLYGYPRDTTPLLDKISQELGIFTDVISTSSHTVPSLMDALSFNHRVDPLEPHRVPDILSVAHRAGFATTWLSNQNAVGVWDNLVAALARTAGHTQYHSTSSGEVLVRDVFDDVMLQTLTRATTDVAGARMTFVHMMASHGPYCGNLPKHFRSPNGEGFGIAMDAAIF